MFFKEELTEEVLRCVFKVHTALGPGLLESAYQACLTYEIEKVGLIVENEVSVPLIYEEIQLDCGYRIDLLIENQLIVELKTVENLTDIHTAQILTYMRIAEIDLGLLLNFNTKSLKNGIKRFVL